MSRPLIQTGRGRWFTADHAFQVTLLIPSAVKQEGKPYAIREAKHGASAFVYVRSLDQVPEAIEEYKNRMAVAALTGKPFRPMWKWAAWTPPRKKEKTGELFGQRLPRPGVRR